jgi:multidrug resistance efflux pump
MARTAVVAGTATVVAGSVASHQQAKAGAAAQEQAADQAAFEAQAEVAELQAQLNAQQAAPAAPEIPTEELEKLGQLHASGVLSDEEFAAAKAKLLGI